LLKIFSGHFAKGKFHLLTIGHPAEQILKNYEKI